MNLKEIIKEEKSTIISLCISVLAGLILVTTIWKNDYTANVPFGILDQDNSSLSRAIVEQFKINPTLDVCYYAESEDDVKTAIKEKKIEAAVMIPPNFSKDVSLKKSPQAVIFADCSNIITGGGAVGAASAVLGTMNAGTQIKMLEGNSFAPSSAAASMGTFSYVERTLYEPQGDYTRKMTYLLVPSITTQTFLISFFIPLLIRKRKIFSVSDRETNRREAREIIVRTLVVGAGAVLSTFIVLCAVSLYKNIPMRGEIFLYFVSTAALMLNVIAFGVFCSSFTKRLACFAQVYMMCSNLIIFTSGLIFPYYLMPKWLAAASKIFNPVANLAVELKAVNLKGIGWDAAWPDLMNSLIYSVFWLTAGIALYAWSIRRERRKAAATGTAEAAVIS